MCNFFQDNDSNFNLNSINGLVKKKISTIYLKGLGLDLKPYIYISYYISMCAPLDLFLLFLPFYQVTCVHISKVVLSESS